MAKDGSSASSPGLGPAGAPEIIDRAPDLKIVRAANPGPMTLDGTRSYVFGRRCVAIIDPGPDRPAQLAALASAVADRDVRWILLTHAHRDHAAGAATTAERFGAPVAGSAGTLDRLERPGRLGRRRAETRALEDGETLALGDDDGSGASLTALHAPGHSPDHVCYLAEPGRRLFTGDLVLGEGSSAILHPEGSVSDYLASLARMIALRPELLLPGHGSVVEAAGARLAEYRRHRLERERQVRAAIADGAATVPEIREAVYGTLPDGLLRAAEASVAAHLAAFAARGEPVPEFSDDYGWREEEAAPGP